MNEPLLPVDPIVESVRRKLRERSRAGIVKYGATLERSDLSRLDWLRHTQEELMDAVLYMERLIRGCEAGEWDTRTPADKDQS